MTRRRDILLAWADTRRAMRLDRPALARRRARLWQAMRPVLAATPALACHAGAALRDIPVTDPATLRADPSAWNSAGIDGGAALASAEQAETGGDGLLRDGIAAGLSTGTSGARGLFLASARERARYIGQSIARLLPVHAPLSGARVALILRASNALYRDVGRGRFAFLHLPLGMAAEDMVAALLRFGPTVLIAPPRELAAIAASGLALPASLRRLFWGSEPMARLERDWIGRRLGIRPDPIYQATEGFIAASCRHGALHLNEDSLEIELEPVPGASVFRPIVTDLRRHVQPIVRVRLDDIVQPEAAPCRCGFAGRVIRPVAGRIADLWSTARGTVTPDLVDDHFVDALGPEARWRVEGSDDKVAIEIVEPRHAEPARRAASSLLPDRRISVRTVAGIGGAKRRRVTWRSSD